MRNLLLSFLLGTLVLGSTGCLIPIYSADPQKRAEQLINESEGMRQIQNECERFWMIDMPSHMTPDRIHGGIT